MSNKMEKIAKLLGLELDEEFIIQGSEYNPYKITYKGLIDKDGDLSGMWLSEILTGSKNIEKAPWRPKDGDWYYCVGLDGSIEHHIFHDFFISDRAMLKCGWLFKTGGGAEANKERVLREMNEVL